jgi:mannitol-1-phosphate 5-dehydrogenase
MSTFVGFGFGPIQAGLFLAEAHLSNNFRRLVVAEVVPSVVDAVRAAGAFTVNIGYADHIAALTVAPVEIYSPLVAADRAALVEAVAAAGEIATALPSVDFYARGGAESVAAILAAGLARKAATGGPLAVVYAAENHTHAARLLETAVLAQTPPAVRDAVHRRVQFLDTIIGKMSGAPEEMADLAELAPGLGRAYLVEAFNRILIDQIARGNEGTSDVARDPAWRAYRRGIEVFVEKDDLAPFAEAKLYGHNAGHALAAYLAHVLGLTRIDQLRQRPDLLGFITQAMVEESGAGLLARYADSDPLFTPAGFAAYAQDLMTRMVNPFVRDTVARVGRDPRRKLGWDDRLVGAMRRARQAGVTPRRYAWGVAAALDWLATPAAQTTATLSTLWGMTELDEEASALCALILQARAEIEQWRIEDCPTL